MKNYPRLAAAALCLGTILADLSQAGPITRAESERQAAVLDQLKKKLAAEPTDAARFKHIAAVMKAEPNVDVRRRILESRHAHGRPGSGEVSDQPAEQ